MSYNDDGVTLEYDPLKTPITTITSAYNVKASKQLTRSFTTPQSYSKEFSTGPMRDSKPSNVPSKDAMKTIVVLDDEPGSTEVKQEYNRIPNRVQNRPGPNNRNNDRYRRPDNRNGNRPMPYQQQQQQNRKPRLSSLPKQEQEYTVILDDDDDDIVAEVPQVKKVKIEANLEQEEKPKEVVIMNTSANNSVPVLNNVNNAGAKVRGKKGKKEEAKKKTVVAMEGDSTPNFLNNPIPSFSEKFQTDNMYIINQMFYFDPIKVSL